MSTDRKDELQRLKQFNPLAENGLEDCKINMTSYFNSTTTQKDNSSLMAECLLNNRETSTHAGASVVTLSIDVSTFLDNLSAALEIAALSRVRTGLAAAGLTVCHTNTDYDDLSKTFKISLKISDADPSLMDIAHNNVENLTNRGFIFKSTLRTTAPVPTASETVFPTRSRRRECILATASDLRRGQMKWSATIDKVLPDIIHKSMLSYIRVTDARGDWDDQLSGSQKWSWLESLYGSKSQRALNQIIRYVKYINNSRTEDQSMYDFAMQLRDEATFLQRKTWTIDEILAIKVYAETLMSVEDTTVHGLPIDYSTLREALRDSFKNQAILDPETIQNHLMDIEKEALGGDTLAKQAGKAFKVGTKRKTHDKVIIPHTPKPSKQYNPPSLTGDVQFTKDAKFCKKCRHQDYLNKTPYYGWCETAVNGRTPHTAANHDKVI